jgi:hypothetical protein
MVTKLFTYCVRFEDFTAVSSGMLRRMALVRTGVSEELSASFIKVTRLGELETTLAVTSKRCTLHASVASTASILPSSCQPDEGSAKFLRNAGS